jgi:hypothetical protein
MQAFQAIADANPGPDGHPSRNSGEPGYWKSVQYVAGLMTDAGYDVTIQPYTFLYYAYTSVPTMSEASPTARTRTDSRLGRGLRSSSSTTSASVR